MHKYVYLTKKRWTYKKGLDLTSHQGCADGNHRESSPGACQNGCRQKVNEQPSRGGAQKREPDAPPAGLHTEASAMENKQYGGCSNNET